MKAIRMHGRGGPDHLVYEEVLKPHPGPGELLVRVEAAAIIASELSWDETYQTTAGAPRPFPIPGRDLSGVVAEVGADVTDIAVGQASMPCSATVGTGLRLNTRLSCLARRRPSRLRSMMC